jgi:predicted RNase H-like HicB family nuclease
MNPRESIEAFETGYFCDFRPEPEGGYTVRCPAFPEIVTYGATLAEAREKAREAIELCLEVYRDEGLQAPVEETSPAGTIREVIPVKLAGI